MIKTTPIVINIVITLCDDPYFVDLKELFLNVLQIIAVDTVKTIRNSPLRKKMEKRTFGRNLRRKLRTKISY